jgi:hypothetical protein
VFVRDGHQRSIPAHPCLELNDPARQPVASSMGARHGGARALKQQRAQILVALPGDAAQPGLAATARLFGHRAEPGGELAAVFEEVSVADARHRGRRGERPDADDRHHALRVAIVLHLRGDLQVAPHDLVIKGLDVVPTSQQRSTRDTVQFQWPRPPVPRRSGHGMRRCLAAGTRRTRPVHRAAG